MQQKSNYKWTFQNIGGATRVKIQSGEDLKHLGELDQKMWTVLSCPVSGLEISDKSLRYMDMDGDGKIHVNDVVNTANWLTTVVKDADSLLQGKDGIALSDINQESEDGKKLYASARQILDNLKKEGEILTVADSSDSIAIFAQTRFNGDGIITESSTDDEALKAVIAAATAATGGSMDRSGAQGINAEQIEAFYQALADYKAWQAQKPELPYADRTDTAIELFNALNAKVKDFFLRSKLAAFSQDSTAALDVQVSRIEAISADNLTEKGEEIASYPIQRVSGKAELDLTAPVNPAWAARFAQLAAIAVEPKKKTLTEAEWDEIGGKTGAYTAWLGAKAGACVEAIGMEEIEKLLKEDRKADLLKLIEEDKALEDEANGIDMVDRLTHLYRDFFTVLKNYITLQDFYNPDQQVKAIFQAGTLIIDQRACHLTMRVENAGAQAALAPASGMYLIYCTCTSKFRPAPIEIVAAMTMGETGDLYVGKHAIFYDRSGLDWDATVTKIIDNPISIRQAFWSPYRRLAKWVEDLINKRAAEKDAKMMSETTAKLQETPAAGADGKPQAALPFDIAKFAGIFAAIGMALGMIGSALVAVGKGLSGLTWWQYLLVFVAIILVISGPSMIMAWLKLRKRNIAPLLNANGWAVNAASIVNIRFGATLTDLAKFPLVKGGDPFAKKGLPSWGKWLISIACIAVVLCGLWLGNLMAWAKLPSPLPCFNKEVAEEVVVTEEAAPAQEVAAEEAAPAETPAD